MSARSKQDYLTCNNTNNRWPVTDKLAARSVVLQDWRSARTHGDSGSAIALNFSHAAVDAWVQRKCNKRMNIDALFEIFKVRVPALCRALVVQLSTLFGVVSKPCL